MKAHFGSACLTEGRITVTIEEASQAAEGEGDSAGDVLARDLFLAIQACVRSYDPIVRWGERANSLAPSARWVRRKQAVR